MSYMNRLTDIALRLGMQKDYEVAYSRMRTSWTAIERIARESGWDIFSTYVSEAVLIQEAERLVEALYHGMANDSPGWDVDQLTRKNAEYGESWCSRGGVGAFMMAARKWDRIVNQVARHGSLTNALRNDKREEGILDDLGDLRRYLLLWLAYLEEKRSPTVRLSEALAPSHEQDINF